MVDATKYLAKEVVERYHEPWGAELGYDEVKRTALQLARSVPMLYAAQRDP